MKKADYERIDQSYEALGGRLYLYEYLDALFGNLFWEYLKQKHTKEGRKGRKKCSPTNTRR